jgi:multidrug efflux pump subunit AcrB
MKRVFEFFVDNWKFSFLMTFMVLILGLLAISQLQRETVPPVNFARVTITTIYPGASAEEVQDRVTKTIEEELRGVDGIIDVRSLSQSDRSEISIRIDIDGVSPDQTVNDIQRAVNRAASRLPSDLEELPIIQELKAKEIPVIEYALTGVSPKRERELIADRLHELIEDVAGVSGVRFVGYREREMQILLEKNKLERESIALSEIVRILKDRIKNVPVGYIRNENQLTLVRLLGKVHDPASISELIIRSNDAGRAVRIKDLGSVVDAAERPEIMVRINGEPATLLIVTKKESADTIKVVEEVNAKISAFKKNLPPGYRLITYNDEGRRIENRLDIVTFNAVIGLMAVLVVLFVFLPGKVGIASSLSLPLCALATISYMVGQNANFNVITMVAIIICLGNLVDNSVVISEHYTSLREQNVEARQAAIQAARQFAVPFTASTVTIIAAFLPMLVTTGVLGQFIRWIPIVVAFALVMSLVEALTLLPSRLQFIHPSPVRKKEKQPYFKRVESLFSGFIGFTLRHRYLTITAIVMLIVSGFLVSLKFNRFELFPAEGVEVYVGRLTAPPGTSIERMDHLAAGLSSAITRTLTPDMVDSVITQAGVSRSTVGDAGAKTGENFATIRITLKPEKAEFNDIKATLQKLRALTVPTGAASLTFEALQSGGPPVGKPLTVTARSSDYGQLKEATAWLQQELSAITGVENIDNDEESAGNEFQIRLRELEAAITQLSLDVVGLNLRTALEGVSVANLVSLGRDYSVQVSFVDRDNDTIGEVMKIRSQNPRGDLFSLSAFANYAAGTSPPVQKNYNFRRAITVTADVDPTVITSVQLNERVRQLIAGQQGRFDQLSWIFGGEDETTKASITSLAVALLLAMSGIFATLVFTFRGFASPLLILSTIPLGLVGVFYAFLIDQRPLSFFAFIGIVGLSGVVINSAIILVDYIEELRRTPTAQPLPELLVTASRARLRAVLATGLTTVVGLVPTAFGLGGYDALLVPLTLALSWGMIVGTVLSLIWIPSGYLIFNDIAHLVAAMKKRGRLS